MKLRDYFVMRGFRLRSFTALFGVQEPRKLAALLQAQDAAQPYGDVYGIHCLRWMLFDPSSKNHGMRSASAREPRPDIQPVEPHALVLSVVFDGNLDDALAGLVTQHRAELEPILVHCHGFDAATDRLEYLKRHATPSGYMFHDFGPVSDAFPLEPDVTRAEIEDAGAVQGRFERFYARHSHEPSPRALRDAFRAAFAEDALPFPLTRFERRESDEESWIRRMADVSRKIQERTARRSGTRTIARGAHAKGHGLLEATFEVVDSAFAVGLFGEPGEYRAILRPSNASGAIQSDRSFDARGLAIGVLVPTNRPIRGKLPEFLVPLETPEVGRQDFVLMNTPVFPAPNVGRFATWFKTFDSDGPLGQLVGLLALAASPGGLREAALFARTALNRVAHPLETEYHSTTPYLLGAHHVAKYSVENQDSQRLRELVGTGTNFLSAALRESLRSQPITLRFYLHVFADSARPRGLPLERLVEDATLDWRKLGAEKVHVANIRVGGQDPAALQALERAETERFTPWNALAEHRPIGSLNRARFAAYRSSQRYRATAPGQLAPALQNAAE